MSRSKIVGILALVTFSISVFLVGNAMAGEKFKWRIVWYTVKSETVNVPSEEGRILLVWEDKGILTVLQGSKLMDGMVGFNVGSADLNTKTGTGVGHGENVWTDRDGDKMYWAWEGKAEKGFYSGQDTFMRGTGKFEGMKGKGTWTGIMAAPNQAYVDRECEVEFPR